MKFQTLILNFEQKHEQMEEWTDIRASTKQYAPSTSPKLGA